MNSEKAKPKSPQIHRVALQNESVTKHHCKLNDEIKLVGKKPPRLKKINIVFISRDLFIIVVFIYFIYAFGFI